MGHGQMGQSAVAADTFSEKHPSNSDRLESDLRVAMDGESGPPLDIGWKSDSDGIPKRSYQRVEIHQSAAATPPKLRPRPF
jgi:hypothetical protein